MNTKTQTLPYTPVSLSCQEVSNSSCIIYKLEVKLLESYHTRKIMEVVREQSARFQEANKEAA